MNLRSESVAGMPISTSLEPIIASTSLLKASSLSTIWELRYSILSICDFICDKFSAISYSPEEIIGFSLFAFSSSILLWMRTKRSSPLYFFFSRLLRLLISRIFAIRYPYNRCFLSPPPCFVARSPSCGSIRETGRQESHTYPLPCQN